MDLDLFKTNKILLSAHIFKHPVYTPFNYHELTDYPSIIDVIANLGIFTVKKVIYENPSA
jgi:hypothetical protein